MLVSVVSLHGYSPVSVIPIILPYNLITCTSNGDIRSAAFLFHFPQSMLRSGREDGREIQSRTNEKQNGGIL